MTHQKSITAFEYRYRDAGNYKIEGQILLTGQLTLQQRDAIQNKMESEQFFVAEQVGIPSLSHKLFVFGGGPTSEDHAWHEFIDFRTVTSDCLGTEGGIIINAEDLVWAFKAVQWWKPELSPNFE